MVIDDGLLGLMVRINKSVPNLRGCIKFKFVRSTTPILEVNKIGSNRLDLFLVSVLQIGDLPFKVMI